MNYDVIILGDGIAGLGAAIGLARYHKKILIIGRKRPGASTAHAAGILDPFLEMNVRSPLFKLAREAFRRYPAWLRSLGVSLQKAGYKKTGMLYLALDRSEERQLRRRFAWQKKSGIPVRWLEAHQIFKMEPSVSRKVRGGLFYPSIPRVQPEKLMKALIAFSQKQGIRILKTKRAAQLICHCEGSPSGDDKARSISQVAGVRLENRLFKSNIVIQAQGAWAGNDRNAEIRLPVKPVRGQALIVQKGKTRISTILHSMDGGYIVPWDPGNLLLGSTVERAGFNPVTTSRGLESIRRRIERIAPRLKGARILTAWAGLRPFPKDRLPIIGAGRIGGVYLATGYYRSGILMSGLAGEFLAKGIVTGKMPHILKPFSMNRFL